MLNRIWLFDFEVMKHEWIMCARNYVTGQRVCINNDNTQMINFINDENPILVGYNNKKYDNYIMKGILLGLSPAIIKDINDFIIDGGLGFQYPFPRGYVSFDSWDLMLDVVPPMSLKEIEGNMGLNIVESSVSFTLERPLEPNEREELIKYCWFDVEALIPLFEARKGYLDSKILLCELIGEDVAKAGYYSNAQLTSKTLGAKKQLFDDMYDYVIPSNLNQDMIPSEILEFVHKYQNKEVDDLSLEFELDNVPHTLGVGGLHGALPKCQFESSDTHVILNVDVSSYYPSLMLQYGYCSRTMASPDIFKGIYEKRLKAKATGDKKTADSLKLVVNTTYGAMLDQTNDLFDPLMGRSVCLSGQLFLIELVNMLSSQIEDFQLVQSNTDGIMFYVARDKVDIVNDIVRQWETKNRFEMETDVIEKVVQKDVNNYIMIDNKGKVKCKGGYLTNYYGGSFKSNSLTILDKALGDYLLYGTPVEETIMNCNDPLKFQKIGKTGRSYDYCELI